MLSEPEQTARLLDRGFGEEDARSRSALMSRAEAALRRLSGEPSRWRWIVPGRLEVFGKHTDYAGGQTLVGALPRGFAVAARDRPDRRLRVIDAKRDELASIDLDDADPPVRGWRSYVAVAARRLARNFPGAPLGADVAFVSDLPRAAGLSSSSALMVGIALALVRRGGLDARDEWAASIASPEARAEYLSCLENGQTYRGLDGAAGVGTEGGSEDHAAIVMGRAGLLAHLRFVPVRHLADVPMPATWRFVVGSSGVHADKAGAVRGRYNRAAQAAAALLEIWRRAAGGSPGSLAVALSGGAPAVARLRELVAHAEPAGFSRAELADRLDHFVREDARVAEAANAFAGEDRAQLGDLAHASQADAERLLGNQVPETIKLVELARACGAYAASSFGAGFGGSAWALIGSRDAEAFGREWMSAYRARYPHQATATWFPATPAPAAIEL
jgi:galactokinase